MNDEGLADVVTASPFRLPRLHPGIGPEGRQPSWPARRGCDWAALTRLHGVNEDVPGHRHRGEREMATNLDPKTLHDFIVGDFLAGPAAAGKQVPFHGSIEGVEVDAVQGTTLLVDGSGTGIAVHLGRFTATWEATVNLLDNSGVGFFHFVAANGDRVETQHVGQAEPTGTPGVFQVVEINTITGGQAALPAPLEASSWNVWSTWRRASPPARSEGPFRRRAPRIERRRGRVSATQSRTICGGNSARHGPGPREGLRRRYHDPGRLPRREPTRSGTATAASAHVMR